MPSHTRPSSIFMASDIAEATRSLPRASNFPAPLPVPAWKRPLDGLVLLLLAPLLVPVMLCIALTIKLVSRGPILFRQVRLGYGGRPFVLLKFRTMQHQADTQIHSRHLDRLIRSDVPMTKLDAVDPRLIPGGRWLRAAGLDELPQVFNILRGDMSVVGPRPCTEYEAERYEPSQRRRFGGLPGVTGLWQVSGKNRLSFEEMIRLDLSYLDSMSFLSDVKILVQTPRAVWAQFEETLEARTHLAKEAPSETEPVKF